MATSARKKYRFASRDSAEAEVARAGASEIQLSIFLDAVLNEPDSIHWKRGHHYDVAVWGPSRMDGGIFATRFKAPNNPGQKPRVTLWGRDLLNVYRRELSRPNPGEELQELMTLIDDIYRLADRLAREAA